MGATTAIESLSRIIAPIMGGWIIGSLHPNWLGWVGGALFTVAVMVAASGKVHLNSERPA